MSDLQIAKVRDFNQFAKVIYLRTIVYIVEQNCPYEEEFDNTDNDAVHYLGTIEDAPVTTCRVIVESAAAKIGRIVTAKEFRNQGYASRLLNHVISDIKTQGKIALIKMSAQDHAMGLYNKLGFEVYGDGYIEAGIPHHMMKMDIR